MPTRNRTTWLLRSDGQYDSRLGWKLNEQGQRVQHRFRIGSDLKEAKRRDELLRRIWDIIEQLNPEQPLWGQDTLEIAKEVAQGRYFAVVKRYPGEEDVPYATRVHRLIKAFPMLQLTTEPHYGAAFGVQLLSAMEKMNDAAPSTVEQSTAESTATLRRLIEDPSLPVDGPLLHQAMQAYELWLAREYAHPEEEITRWGRTQIKQMESLRSHHRNAPLNELGRAKVEGLMQYWRKRPLRKGSTTHRVTQKTASNILKTLKRFFRWLHASEEFKWRKPEDFHELSTSVAALEHERRSQITPSELFTLDELKLLFAYGQPLDRLLILLGLNCGFVVAESATLLVQEVCLRTAHSARHQEILDFVSTAEHSFIKRVRRKNNVYGEFLLWETTVKGIEWAMQERRRQPGFGQRARVLLNSAGQPYDHLTAGGNACQQIPNMFARLKKRITEDNGVISDLPFKMLRKTGGDLVKRFSDGETMGVFHCRGEVKETRDDLADEYAARKFGKVFRALQQVESYLAPMFAAAGPDPFLHQPQAYTPRTVIASIIELHNAGVRATDIAEQVGKSLATVQRHISSVSGPRHPGRPKKSR